MLNRTEKCENLGLGVIYKSSEARWAAPNEVIRWLTSIMRPLIKVGADGITLLDIMSPEGKLCSLRVYYLHCEDKLR
ncbi:hypothetical protein CBE01nite_08920 [Clostridium beijerinckii]|uniref:hypothetical protein n=1 Tax=Clostridium beijerinckii TaxID=1520 RepID=UPI00098CC4EF|nr:hypothetical protein [Clostridium beijerinckii]GEP63124.1 hypothetical protein CBE01nite_08920 [Clostridium beijerinckii]